MSYGVSGGANWPGRIATGCYSRRVSSAAGVGERKHAPVQRRCVELTWPTTDFYYHSPRRLLSSPTTTTSFWTQSLHHHIPLPPSEDRNYCTLIPSPLPCARRPRSVTLTCPSRPEQTAHVHSDWPITHVFAPSLPNPSTLPTPRRLYFEHHQVGGPLHPQVFLRSSSSRAQGVGLRRRLQEAPITGLWQHTSSCALLSLHESFLIPVLGLEIWLSVP